MHLIFLCKARGQVGQLRLSSRRLWLAAAGSLFALCALAFYAGIHAASAIGVSAEAQLEAWQAELTEQEALLAATRAAMQQNIDALTLRLGQMNAHVVRLDALGSRLTQMAGLEEGEFDFSGAPALGGPEQRLPVDQRMAPLGTVMSALDVLDEQLQDRRRQLGALESLMLDRRLRDEVRPEGRPVSSGYVSSRFGNRADPFTGRQAFHQGIDFAGRDGADVLAVASGVVIWSGRRDGYGKLIEINHGNGYVTRYAHNSDNMVAVGDTVRRGQRIAKVGSTGRATGPHLHFEVLRHGRPVDPLAYVR